jgi:hypothetical protein
MRKKAEYVETWPVYSIPLRLDDGELEKKLGIYIVRNN